MKISVVIPAYNEEEYLKPCLDALLAQKEPVHEIIVVDNNSTDKTVEVARQYRVKLLKENKQGVVFARNRGFKAASGYVIGRIDADTRVKPDWTRRLIKHFSDPKIAAVGGAAYYYDQPSPKLNQKLDIAIRKQLNRATKRYGVFLQGMNMALRKSVWQSVASDVCDEVDIHEDIDLTIHLAMQKFKVIFDEKLVVGASTRRFDNTVGDYYEYCRAGARTLKRHGVPSETISSVVGFMLLIHMPFKVLRRLYDSETDKISLSKAIYSKHTARKNPII